MTCQYSTVTYATALPALAQISAIVPWPKQEV